ncbi:NAD(P)-binding protein [Methanocaldococcus sp.]
MKIGIVGGGLGGLLTGALLSKNHEVVIFEKLPFLGGRFTNLEYEGFQLTTGALHMIPHGNDGYLAQLLRKAGANVKVINSNPDGTFLINGKEYLYKDLFSLLGFKEKVKAITMSAKLKLGNVDKNISFGEFLEDVELALKIGNAFTGWALSLTAYETPMSEIIEIAKNYYKFGGPGIPIGGCKAVIDELLRIIKTNNGKIIKEYDVKKIEIDEKAYIDDYEFDVVVSNISPIETQKICNIKFLKSKPKPSKGIKISIATKEGIIRHGGVLFTPECERINGLNQVTNVDKSLAPEGWHLVMTHQAQITNNVKKEIDLGLEDIDRLFKGKDYRILHIQSYRESWPVNHASNGTDIDNIVNDKLFLVGDGCKGRGGIEVEGIALGVLKVVNYIEHLNKKMN